MQIAQTDVNQLMNFRSAIPELSDLPSELKAEVILILERLYKILLKCISEDILSERRIEHIITVVNSLEDRLSDLIYSDLCFIILHSVYGTISKWLDYLISIEQFESVVNLKKIVH